MDALVARAAALALAALLILGGCAAPPGDATATAQANEMQTPSPLPPRPPFPTMPAVNQPASSMMQTIMQLPDAILNVDIAANPLSGDPVVAAIAAPLTTAGNPHAFVRAFDRATQTWGPVQSLDIGPSQIANHRFRSVAVAVSGDGAITAVWGATAHPTYGLWASTSRDRAATWGQPQRLADNMFGVLDVAATLDGQVAVLALRREPTTPVLIVRGADGAWGQPDPIPVSSAWYGTSGGLTIAGEGAAARVVALTTGFRQAPGLIFLASRPLDSPGAWQVATRQVSDPPGEGLVGNVRGLAAAAIMPEGNSRSLVAFTFAIRGAPGAYAVSSNDGGASWGDITTIAGANGPNNDVAPFSALAFDPAAQRLVAIWTCCEDARWGSQRSTHYGAWSIPGSAEWQPREQVPIITGALAQAPNARFAWLAWVENGNTVAARALDLGRIVAADQYPAPTPGPRQP